MSDRHQPPPAWTALHDVIAQALELARAEPSIEAIALVGSCARGEPGPDSDVDLVVLTNDKRSLCAREDWFHHFGEVRLVRREEFGDVSERRLRRSDGLEVEVGLAPPTWAGTEPVDEGVAQVVRDGFSVVLDPELVLARLALAVHGRP